MIKSLKLLPGYSFSKSLSLDTHESSSKYASDLDDILGGMRTVKIAAPVVPVAPPVAAPQPTRGPLGPTGMTAAPAGGFLPPPARTPAAPVTRDQVVPADLRGGKKPSAHETAMAQGGTGNSYKIQKGDNLSSIAKRNGTTVEALMKANPGISDKNKIQAGASLNLSGNGNMAAPAAPKGKAPVQAAAKPAPAPVAPKATPVANVAPAPVAAAAPAPAAVPQTVKNRFAYADAHKGQDMSGAGQFNGMQSGGMNYNYQGAGKGATPIVGTPMAAPKPAPMPATGAAPVAPLVNAAVAPMKPVAKVAEDKEYSTAEAIAYVRALEGGDDFLKQAYDAGAEEADEDITKEASPSVLDLHKMLQQGKLKLRGMAGMSPMQSSAYKRLMLETANKDPETKLYAARGAKNILKSVLGHK